MARELRDFGQRIVAWFSCGATSAVATKLALARWGHDRVVVARILKKRLAADADNLLRGWPADIEPHLRAALVDFAEAMNAPHDHPERQSENFGPNPEKRFRSKHERNECTAGTCSKRQAHG